MHNIETIKFHLEVGHILQTVQSACPNQIALFALSNVFRN